MNATAAAAPPSPTLGWTWSNVDPVDHFATTYAQAREKFLAAATARGLEIDAHLHPSRRGPDGGALAIDVTVLGEAKGRHALMLTSATHGVEGFCGSGCQVALLNDDAVVAAVAQKRVAVVLVHALNPFGFAHLARTNEDNVDLNRNFRDFSQPARNDAYLEVHDFIVPASWPPAPDNEQRLQQYVATRGAAALQQAVTAGQWDRPDGLFYGGARPTWSHERLRDILRRHGASRRKLGWIDFHTGLGPCGHGEKIFAGPDDAPMLARAKAWWGGDVTSIWDGTSTSAKLAGMLFQAAIDECPDTEYTGIALEYGTQSYFDVIGALRGRQWLANHPDAPAPLRDAILARTRDAFHVDTPAWKAMVYGQARTAVLQALSALAEH
jgi:predicted deacylase